MVNSQANAVAVAELGDFSVPHNRASRVKEGESHVANRARVAVAAACSIQPWTRRAARVAAPGIGHRRASVVRVWVHCAGLVTVAKAVDGSDFSQERKEVVMSRNVHVFHHSGSESGCGRLIAGFIVLFVLASCMKGC